MKKTEKEKMLSGEPYSAMGKELANERLFAKRQLYAFNALHPDKQAERDTLIRELFGSTGTHFYIEPPFRCDYGYNICIGENFYSNYNCTILDCAAVTIGDDVMFAPNVSIFTAGHPLHHEPRTKQYEYAFPVSIGHRVWIGGNVVVNPAVRIGDHSVIGAGSVVTKDIPANVVAVGNPCRVLRQITDDDRQYYFKQLKF